MDATRLLEGLLRSTLGGRGKKSRGALDYLVGGGRKGGASFLTASRLLAAVGVAWGLYETWKNQSSRAPLDGAPAPVTPQPNPTPALAGPGPIPDGLERLVRLTIAAARCDGAIADAERDRILAHAREAGIEPFVRAELDRPHALDQIVTAPPDPALGSDLYVLAFSIVRADEGVNPKERAWLDDLARRLGLDASTTARIEAEAARAIDAAAGA